MKAYLLPLVTAALTVPLKKLGPKSKLLKEGFYNQNLALASQVYLYTADVTLGTPKAAYPEAQSASWLIDLNSQLSFAFSFDMTYCVDCPSVDQFYNSAYSFTFAPISQTTEPAQSPLGFDFAAAQVDVDNFCLVSDQENAPYCF